MEKSRILLVVGIILSILLVWGLIGSSEASEIGITCDLGIDSSGSVFCWKWHQNVIGDIGESVDDFFNG